MAVLSAVFKAVDQLSDVLDRMSAAGATALERWERSAGAADDALSRAADGAERAGRAASDAADRIESTQDQLDRLGEEADDAADRIDRLNGEVDDAGDHLDDLRDHLDEAGDDLDDFGDDADDAGNDSERFGERASNALQTVSNILASAGIIKGVQELAGAFFEASDAAAAFETATMKVSTIADTNAVSLDTLANGVMDMSLDTGQAVGDLSEALYSALSASVDTANSVQFTATATKLATGGFTSSATSVDVLTTALNAYGLEADKAGSISDMLITTQNLGKTTVDELAASVGKVIPLASAYGVEMDNLSAAYAELTKGGIATAEAGTYLKGMLRELGDSGSTVSKTLIEETGYSFAQLMQQGYSLGDVLDVLGETVGGDAGAFNELWSSAEAGLGALSLYNAGAAQFNTTLDAMQNSLGATEAAYATMTNTTAHSKEEMQNAAANLQIVIGQNLNPAIEKLYGIGTSALTVATRFAQDHPIVVKALAAVAVGVGAVAVGIAGFTFVTQVAIPAIASFGVALNAALGPIGWVALGITGIVAAGAALIAMFQEEETEYDTWTASTKKQYDALQDLNGEYERAVETYGATSEEASRLRYQIDDLNAEFEASKMTVEEFTAKCDALAASHEELAQSYAESTASIDAEEVGTLALIQKLNDLASSSEQTAATQMQMQSIVDDLSQSFPDLGLSIENVTQNTDAMVAALKKAAEEQANQERYQENYDTYVSLLKEQAQLEEQIAAAEENIRLEQERLDGMSGWDQFWTGTDDLEAYQAALEELQAAQADNLAMQGECEQAMQDYADAAAEAADASISYEDAVSNAITAVSDDLNELAEKYQEAYGAALESVQGQYALWDEAEKVTATSASSINSALESQVSYWEKYNANLAGLTERSADIEGLSDMIASFADGSTDSVNAVAGMASATDEELAAMVANWQSLQDVQGTTADSLAQLETDFNDSLASIEERMNEAVGNMNMDTEAASAAKATIDAYIASIRAGTAEAGNAAEAVAAATAKALSGNGSGVTGYATGTTYAEPGVHIVGEEGPEAILFRGGETVLDADDTRQYLAGQRPLQTSVPDVTDAHDSGPNGGEERRIVLELAGRGSLELSGSNFDPDTAAEWLADNLRPLLISTLKQEILEEGDGSRDF
ncbi:phage tail tape measure protein [Acutalibacter muris]|mgnify:FL=1|uniref:phage tail tape measure protein n=1 Tax=Acutalibacter muris TaxID=1796620 RepID=UPI000ED4AC1F|nr:phage tail tape measure protein [Acutalibacter muris]RKJ82845.1 phage tail tape measure protein [Butyricicoccus sp. 1XD8-22]